MKSVTSDSNDWVSKYHKAEDGRVRVVEQRDSLERDLKAQLSQAEQRASQAETRLTQAQQQASNVEATLTRERQSWEKQIQAAQAQASAAPAAMASTTPGRQHCAHWAPAKTKLDFAIVMRMQL